MFVSVCFYHNVLIAMQKEFLCPSVGALKLCGTIFEKGRNSHVPMEIISLFVGHLLSILCVFSVNSAVQMRTKHYCTNAWNSIRTERKKNLIKCLKCRRALIPCTYNWIFLEYLRTKRTFNRKWLNCFSGYVTFRTHHFRRANTVQRASHMLLANACVISSTFLTNLKRRAKCFESK